MSRARHFHGKYLCIRYCRHEKDGRYFVYTLDENGYRQAVWISVGDQVGDYRIITEGLKSGDEVVLQ